MPIHSQALSARKQNSAAALFIHILAWLKLTAALSLFIYSFFTGCSIQQTGRFPASRKAFRICCIGKHKYCPIRDR